VRPATVPAAFAAATAADPARPLLTWYDDRTGERAELSGATCANWLSKTANMLVDGYGAAAGEEAVVDAPPHWQTAVIMLGCWSAGLAVTAGAAAPGAVASTTVVFATADRAGGYAGRAAEVFGLALAPLAAPLREGPAGVADYVTEVRAYGDFFTPARPVAPDDPATPDASHDALCERAADRASALGISAPARVLIDTAAYPDPLDWLLAPLVAGASVVLCGHLDPATVAARTAAERVNVTLVR
jgi:uncharacterized protein (TIGR03089 family)